MKVYVVCADNGMSYEDYSHWIDSIHASLESATNYIQARKKRLNDLPIVIMNFAI